MCLNLSARHSIEDYTSDAIFDMFDIDFDAFLGAESVVGSAGMDLNSVPNAPPCSPTVGSLDMELDLDSIPNAPLCSHTRESPDMDMGSVPNAPPGSPDLENPDIDLDDLDSLPTVSPVSPSDTTWVAPTTSATKRRFTLGKTIFGQRESEEEDEDMAMELGENLKTALRDRPRRVQGNKRRQASFGMTPRPCSFNSGCIDKRRGRNTPSHTLSSPQDVYSLSSEDEMTSTPQELQMRSQSCSEGKREFRALKEMVPKKNKKVTLAYLVAMSSLAAVDQETMGIRKCTSDRASHILAPQEGVLEGLGEHIPDRAKNGWIHLAYKKAYASEDQPANSLAAIGANGGNSNGDGGLVEKAGISESLAAFDINDRTASDA
ncbi:hypothetical protein DSL72_000244 [Monilinia vaccinii-corymbosi]|uniref:Uncharacterized protein n=1 Tax=Monilinia vaccinii-corymbosi TaxID=61207 RepID=A0A8A3P5H3_9HELO|nr:hypothetical protein DSL72_000244 [Monilinia vaccinii-corymbosi]